MIFLLQSILIFLTSPFLLHRLIYRQIRPMFCRQFRFRILGNGLRGDHVHFHYLCSTIHQPLHQHTYSAYFIKFFFSFYSHLVIFQATAAVSEPSTWDSNSYGVPPPCIESIYPCSPSDHGIYASREFPFPRPC